jgi:hypothetical protein
MTLQKLSQKHLMRYTINQTPEWYLLYKFSSIMSSSFSGQTVLNLGVPEVS